MLSFAATHAQFNQKSDIFGLPIGSFQGRGFPTAVHGEQRRWVRGCNLYCGHMSQNLSTNHLNSDYSRLIKLQSFLGERLKTCEFWLACSCTKPTKLQLLIGFETPAYLFLNFVILTCCLKLRF